MNSFVITRVVNDLYNLTIFINRQNYNIDHITNNGTTVLAYTTQNYTDSQILDINNIVNTFEDNHDGDNGIKRISRFNSTHNLLPISGIYEGVYEDISDYSTLSLSCISDQKGQIEVNYSNNGTDLHYKDVYNISGNICFFDLKTITFRYYKIRYLNDYKAQGIMSLLTTVHMYKTSINNDVSIKKSVEIQEETIKTGGNYRSESKKITIQPNTTQSYTYIWPYRTSVLEMRFITEEIHRNDVLNFYVARDTIVGVLIENTIIGSNKIKVSPTVIQNINLGYIISLVSSTGVVINLGDVLGISADTLTISNPTTDIFIAGSYIKMTLQPVRNVIISAPWEYNVGRSKIGSSSIPPNTNLTIEYTNNSTNVKDFVWYFDYLY